ncbi:MAG TPA: AAA family ATPase [Nitriliruptorales bacterium]|nr:AAA family ATPase [Nitriliruptorales bacterium]
MKIVVTGKGGAGKTTVAAILARTLARTEREVIAVDADPNPNLGMALGLGAEATERLEAIVNVVLRDKAAHGHEHDHEGHACDPPRDRSAPELVDDLAVAAPDGVRLVQTGLIERPAEGCLCCGSHGTTRRIVNEVPADGRVVVADLEAGVNDLIWAYPKADDVVVVVTEPYVKSLEVARRALQVTRDVGVRRVLVAANRLESDEDLADVASALPDVEIVAVPEDPAVWQADRDGVAALDAAPDSPAVAAVAALAARLVELEPAPTG